MLNFVERFFKLTLDNVYRFMCSILFLLAVLGCYLGTTPITQATMLLNWLEVPSAWLGRVAAWLGERQEVVEVVASGMLCVAVFFAFANDSRSRSGSTALLSFVLLAEIGRTMKVVSLLGILVFVIVAITIVVAVFARRAHKPFPGWMKNSLERPLKVVLGLVLAAFYVFSPLGWLIAQEPLGERGTRMKPLYVARLDSTN